MRSYLKEVLKNIPKDWLNLTTHRLDVYNEELAKTQFLEQFEILYADQNASESALMVLPTAFDYIRLGHPLSCLLEWAIGKMNHLEAKNVIAFSSEVAPILAILRKNLLEGRNTQLVYTDELPAAFDIKLLSEVYHYQIELKKITQIEEITAYDGSTIFVDAGKQMGVGQLSDKIDFQVQLYPTLGSVVLINGKQNEPYISETQHVRRRETIAMTPANCALALQSISEDAPLDLPQSNTKANKKIVLETIASITGTPTKALLGSSGLSIQYAIMMGLIDHAIENHPNKAIKFIVPPNCYGGTNDQARRVAACLDQVEILDFPVDGDHDMVESLNTVLEEVAKNDAVPYIIAEIPTNPRVEVPDLEALKKVLSASRKTTKGTVAIAPVFILDQTFCPNVPFLAEGGILSTVPTISYASGSKFPSGGLCTAGYCVGNQQTVELMKKVETHLHLCDNKATSLQIEILAQQMPSMLQRIKKAYQNTRELVNFIQDKLPDAKINFVFEELAEQGFTPSVFSLDLPTKGQTEEEREAYKRKLNHQLITQMITKIPEESKHCVSYGQLKGCYWTIPATSTQGTTKESDKDYIARVSVSPNLDLERHKKVFLEFINQM